MIRTRLVGTGHFVPDTILTNKDLEKMMDTTDEWIVTRTGIRERHIAHVGDATSDYCAEAARRALKRAGIAANELDYIIIATVTGDMKFPSTAIFTQAKIGAKNAAVMDIAGACTGFIYGIDLTDGLIKSGKAKKVLVIGSEILTSMVNFEDRATAVLFGDGAGAAIFVAEETNEKVGVLSTYVKSDGTLAHLLYCDGAGSLYPPSQKSLEEKRHFLKMAGNDVYKHAVRMMEDSAMIALDRAGVTKEEVDILFPHQANIRIIEATQKRLNLPDEKVYINIDRYGNTSAASIGIAMDEAVELGRFKKGDLAVLVAFGGGFTWGSVALRY